MTRTEAIRKIEKCMMDNSPGSERVELYNFQQHGFSNDMVYELLEAVRKNNPELDPRNEIETVQAILAFRPEQDRVRAAAYRYLGDYTEAGFREECGYLNKINEIFDGANLTEDEIRAAFCKE